MTTPYSSYASGSGAQSSYSTQSTPTSFTPVMSNFDQSQPSTPTPSGRGRPRGSGTGAKRGRKPKGTVVAGASSPRPFAPSPLVPTGASATTSAGSFLSSNQGATGQASRVHWAAPGGAGTDSAMGGAQSGGILSIPDGQGGDAVAAGSVGAGPVIDPALVGMSAASSVPGTPRLGGDASLNLSTRLSQPPAGATRPGMGGAEEDIEADDELLPAMADDDYSAQLSWQSQSKDNLKVLMDNFSPAQYDRFEAYRRHALPKQAVRKVIQQTLGHQVSQPVAQIIAGFSKVFVGEMVEKARAVQARRGEAGPLSPDHLREAYRAYQAETGRVGAARPLRSKKLFVR